MLLRLSVGDANNVSGGIDGATEHILQVPRVSMGKEVFGGVVVGCSRAVIGLSSGCHRVVVGVGG